MNKIKVLNPKFIKAADYEKCGHTMSWLARKSGIAEATFIRWMKGDVNIVKESLDELLIVRSCINYDGPVFDFIEVDPKPDRFTPVLPAAECQGSKPPHTIKELASDVQVCMALLDDAINKYNEEVDKEVKPME